MFWEIDDGQDFLFLPGRSSGKHLGNTRIQEVESPVVSDNPRVPKMLAHEIKATYRIEPQIVDYFDVFESMAHDLAHEKGQFWHTCAKSTL